MRTLLPMVCVLALGCAGSPRPAPLHAGADMERADTSGETAGTAETVEAEALGRAFRSVPDARALLDAPIASLGFDYPNVEMANWDTGERRPFGTCAEYRALSANGFAMDVPAIDAWMAVRLSAFCAALDLATRCQTPDRSAVADFDVVRDGLAALPAGLVDMAHGDAPSEGVLADRYPREQVLPATDGLLRVCPPGEDEGDRTCIDFEVLGRGDVDGDGAEDLIVSVTAESGGASSDRFGVVRALSRESESEPLRILTLDVAEE
ncbi:MAG: hypothetical protein AB7S26_09835 [Sandaracinaceae bacterium]